MEFSLDTDEKKIAAAIQRVLAAHPSLHIYFDVVGHEVRAIKNEKLAEPQFPLDVQVIDGENGPVIEVVYDDALYSAELSANIGRYCRTVIRRFAENGEARLRSISLLDEEEKLLLDRFHTVPEEAEVSPDTFFFSDMEKFAAAYPERTALIAVDGTFRYGEFDRITDRVANALIKRGGQGRRQGADSPAPHIQSAVCLLWCQQGRSGLYSL